MQGVWSDRSREQAEADRFGYYLAGLADGEGCFSIERRGGRGGGSWGCSFKLKLRTDDKPLLEGLQHATGVGKLYTATQGRFNPCTTWVVQRKDEVGHIVSIFDAYPLRSKKARDFAIWREAVVAWYSHGYGESWADLERLSAEIKSAREYREAA